MNQFILFQSPPDYYYLNLFKKIKKEEQGYKYLGLYPILFFPKFFDIIFILPIIIRYIRFRINKNKWHKIYQKIGLNFYKPKKKYFISSLFKSIKKYNSLKCNADILNLTIDNIKIGDLVYDTYLRFYNKPTLNNKNFGIFIIILRSYQFLAITNELYSSIQLKKYFSSYCTYINHGLPVRFFLRKNIEVFSAGNVYEIIKKHIPEDYLQTRNLEFSKTFNKHEIQLGLDKISRRVEGIEKLPFMRATTYNNFNTNEYSTDLDGIVFLHDIFDSPHIFGEMIFEDFFKWTIYTLDLIREFNLKIGIKPHPNQTNESQQIVAKLKSKYRDLNWIDESISNNVLLGSKIKFGVSVYGSIIGELAYFNKFSITCGNNPYNGLSFIRNSKNITHYKETLLESVGDNKSYNFKDDVGAFYYRLYDNNLNHYNISDKILENRFNEKVQKIIYDNGI